MSSSPQSGPTLGIDPGLNRTGYAVVEKTPGGHRLLEAGVIRSPARRPLGQRLAAIHQGVADVVASFHPGAMAIEELYTHYERPRTAILMGHARGVICLAAAEANVPIRHYAATRVKRILTGSGRAPKRQLQQAVRREFALDSPPEPPDVADALAIALCHIYAESGLPRIEAMAAPLRPEQDASEARRPPEDRGAPPAKTPGPAIPRERIASMTPAPSTGAMV